MKAAKRAPTLTRNGMFHRLKQLRNNTVQNEDLPEKDKSAGQR